MNTRLASYAQLHELVDAWVVVAPDDVNHVYRWRLQALWGPSLARILTPAVRPHPDPYS